MSSYENVNRPVRTAVAVVDRVVEDVHLDNAEDAYREHELVVKETLVEEVSIDGMCGVY